MLTELTIFTIPYLSELSEKEATLKRAEERLSLVKMQLEVLEKALPKLQDDYTWEETYYTIERLHRQRTAFQNTYNEAWAAIKTVMTKHDHAPECSVVQITSFQKSPFEP